MFSKTSFFTFPYLRIFLTYLLSHYYRVDSNNSVNYKDVDISVWQRLSASGVLFTIYLHVYDNDDDDDEVRWSVLSYN